MPNPRNSSKLLVCLAGAFALLACATASELPPKPVTRVVPSGQRLVMVLNRDHPDGEQFRSEYFARNFPLAKAQGMYECHSFRVEAVVAGERNPQAASFFAWPSPQIAEAFRQEEEYATLYAPRRAEGWLDLQVMYMDLTAPVTLDLNPERHYTVAVLWLKDPEAYDRYFRDMDQLRAELGARVVLKQPVSRYDSLREPEAPAPHWVILMEWKDAEGPRQYIESAHFNKHRGAHDAALDKIEMYRLAFWTP